MFRILTLSPGSVTQSLIECLVTLGHALNGVMYPWIWCFETPCGVTQPRIECFEALAVLCIPRFDVSKHWRPKTGVVQARTECFKALLTPTAVLGIVGFGVSRHRVASSGVTQP